jgi:hypothetical protein
VNEPPRLWDVEGDALMRDLLSSALDDIAPSTVRERSHEVIGWVLAQGAFEVTTASGVFDAAAGRGEGTGFDAGAGDAGRVVEPMVRDTAPLPLLPPPGVPANDPVRVRARAGLAGLERVGFARRMVSAGQVAAAVAIGVAGAHVVHFARTSTADACSARSALAGVACPAACEEASLPTALSAASPDPRGIEPVALVAASIAGPRRQSRSASVAGESGGATPLAHGGPETEDWLGEQLSLLARAEHRLRAGDGSGALRALDEYADRYPRGLLDVQVAQLRDRAAPSYASARPEPVNGLRSSGVGRGQ